MSRQVDIIEAFDMYKSICEEIKCLNSKSIWIYIKDNVEEDEIIDVSKYKRISKVNAGEDYLISFDQNLFRTPGDGTRYISKEKRDADFDRIFKALSEK